ncbi:HET-domain-containing protein [Aspergillus costaricaensis CBS 115574]|uniref:HET-domain-containing protein n=1 Tax=Aspergillus costaricaensis CBS 115574 TaxID=1448317 RepID=A0ACD1IIN7_9EURO|nr:HET-domain-containing protein [Aspergillus costaricaensis CBS 115574]RAK90178.1 HET-domain-containing protein [Aspergillus costaricaensis CBS 115574]
MRLLNVKTLKLEYFYGSVPAYAILSHTWGADDEELSFDDIEDGRLQKGATMPYKVAKCCAQAEKDGLNYAWVDTCYIIKADPTELGEAINSMLRWYNEAAICYAYLADVSSGENGRFPLTQFCSCRWFKRGWTLQELLAPDNLRFYDSRWHYLGTKATSYRAFTRLQQEIMRKSRGESMLAWGFQATEQKAANSKSTSISAGVLAASPADFMNCGDIVPQKKKASFLTAVKFDGGYVRISLSLFSALSGEQFGLLNCGPQNNRDEVVGIHPLLVIRPLTERQKNTSTDPSPSNYFFLDDPVEIGLELIEVEPPECWLKEHALIATSSDPNVDSIQRTWTRFRPEGNRAHDFLVLLEFQAKRSQFQARCHMMISARNTPLADLAQSAGRLRQDAFGKRIASDCTLSIQASVERDSLQKIFVLKLATVASPPSVTVDTTFELDELMLKLERESLMKDKDNVCGEVVNIKEQEVKASSSLEFAKASLAKTEEKRSEANSPGKWLWSASASDFRQGNKALGSPDGQSMPHSTPSTMYSGWILGEEEPMPSDSELVDSEAKLAKDIWKIVKDDAFLTGPFKDKEYFLAHLVKKAILILLCTNKRSTCPAMEYTIRRDAQAEFVKRMTEAKTKTLPHGKGVALRFINHDADNASNLNSESIQNIMESLPLRSLGYTAIVENLRSKVLEPLVYEKSEDRRLDRPLIVTITIGGYLEFGAESELADDIIECGKKLHDAGYARSSVKLLIVSIGWSRVTMGFLERLQSNPDIRPVIAGADSSRGRPHALFPITSCTVSHLFGGPRYLLQAIKFLSHFIENGN